MISSLVTTSRLFGRALARPSSLTRLVTPSTRLLSTSVPSLAGLGAGSGQGGKVDKAAAAKAKLAAVKAKEKERLAKDKAKVKAAQAKLKQREKDRKAVIAQKEKALKAEKLKKEKEKKRAQIKVKSKKLPVKKPTRSSLHPPKAAQNAWQIFATNYAKERRDAVSGSDKPSVASLWKEAAPAYQRLDADEKATLLEQAKEQREAYPALFNAWVESLTPAQIKEENLLRHRRRKEGKSTKSNLRIPGAPKQPLTGFMRFSSEVRRERPEVLQGETSILKQSGLVAAAWKSLSDEERKVYNDASVEERKEYVKLKADFDAKQAAKARGE